MGFETVDYEYECLEFCDFDRKSEDYYQKVSEDALGNKNPTAFLFLAKMYLKGDYVRKDIEKGIKYLKFAYEYSDGKYGCGWGTKYLFDIREEILEYDRLKKCYIDYMEYLVKNGDYSAAIELAYNYDDEMAPKNIQRKLELLNMAKDHDIEYAYDCLGEIYFLGEEVEQNYEKAYIYFTHDTEYESFVKSYYLGEMYREGLYVEKDTNKAKEYYRNIADNYHPYGRLDEHCEKARKRLAELEKE